MAGSKLTNIAGILPYKNQPVKLKISDGLISDIILDEPSKTSVNNLYVAPGFIDNQVNGYMGIEFTEPNLTVDKVQKVTKELWKTGITTYLPTIITCDSSILEANVKVLADAAKEIETGSSIPGVHLEGPYISAEDGYRGAHDKRWVRPPDWNEFLRFNRAAQNRILLITMAPEVKGAIEFIRKVKKLGITVALGHHNAAAEIIKKAVEAGASIVTHLGNGCADMIHRHHNPIWPQLANDRLMASLIVDGIHLTPEEVKTFYKVKKERKLILVSDMTKLAGMLPGEYEWNQKKMILTAEGLIRFKNKNMLAGSSLILRKGIENMIMFTGCSLNKAIKMATQNPADLNGLDDRGKIEVGKRADLVLFTYENGQIHIKKTVVAGKIVYNDTF